jgi:EmrB/QacA subfamily drug resistance transporter
LLNYQSARPVTERRREFTLNRRIALTTFAITSLALFMVSLDNLVVTTALPVIKAELGASLAQLEWTVNAYTLTFAVLLLTGAALGDRFGRKRVFIAGLSIFTFGSAAAALSTSGDTLVLARAVQGLGAALVTPLTLTLLSAAVPTERRGLALGAWGGIAGLAIALGPLVGGAIVEGVSWQWIFWVNVPIGLVTIPLAAVLLVESRGPETRLDIPGLTLASGGLLALVWGLIHGNDEGWTSAPIVTAFVVAAILLAGFVAWERRTASPMLPPRFFRSRQFSAANGVGFLMSFGMFGSIFLLAQFFQIVQGYSPFEAGLRTLPWTGMPIIVAPIAGALSDRIHPRLLLVAGMGLMGAGLAWIAALISPTVDYVALVPAFMVAGAGMGLFFAPTANLVLSAVRREEEGRASGANNTIREVGGVFGVAVLASVFSAFGGYASPQAFVDGLVPAVWVGAVFVAAGAFVALLIPARRTAGIGQPAHAESGRDGAATDWLGEPHFAPELARIDR